MEVKEAIQWLESIKWADYINVEKLKKIKGIISLLQRGEVYEEIVEKLRYELDTPKSILINGEDIRNRIEQLEQKYFPKEEVNYDN